MLGLLAPNNDALTGWLSLVFLGAFLAGGYFYWVLYSIGARETGRRTKDFYFPTHRIKGDSRALGRDGWVILLKLLSPRWWGTLVRSTEWPGLLVVVLLLSTLMLGFVGAMAGIV